MATSFDTGFKARAFSASDGLKLFLRDYGSSLPASSLPVICLPGLTRNARDFHQLALILSTDAEDPRRVIALDYRGRGLSDRDGNKANYNPGVEANDVITACAFLGIPRAIFIGTSRGGLILHLLALMKPELIAGIVLNDVGPVLELEGLRHIQNYLGKSSPPSSWREAADTLRALHGGDFPALRPQDWNEMAQAIYREIAGRITADFDPAIADAMKTANLNKPLPDLWPQFEALTTVLMLVVRGENSRLLSADTVREMMARHRGAREITAAGQGHAPLLHLDGIAMDIRRFLRTCS